jgi:hypothetical protein
MKNIIFVLILLLLTNCGVATDSSGVPQDAPSSTLPETPDDGNETDPTDPNDPTDPGDGNETAPIEDPVFDPTDGAVYDPNACKSSYAIDTPLEDDALSDRETDDNVNGISLQSLLRVTLNKDDSNIILYYKKLSIDLVSTNPEDRENMYGLNAEYIVMYDLAWVQEPNNTLYAELPNSTNSALKRCYKITLNSETGSEITPIKVYR